MNATSVDNRIVKPDRWKALHAEGSSLTERQLMVALEAAGMAVWEWDIATDRIAWNDQHFILFGLTEKPQEISSEFFLGFVHPADRAIVGKAITEAIEVTGIYRAEFRVVKADDNEVRWMSGYGRLAPAGDSGERRMIGVMYDITDRKMLERHNDDLVAVASHELRTPVTSLKAYAQLLQEAYAGRPESDEKTMINRVAYQAEKLTLLIGQLLDSARISSNQLVLRCQPFDFDEMVSECIADIMLAIGGHPVILEAGKCGIITADRQKLEQVCINLSSNAIKYSPPGEPVIVGTGRNRVDAWFEVQDRGPGVPQELQHKIFERFYRVDQEVADLKSGIGLGLYISANIIRMHNGKIGVVSNKGEGALFYFTVPVAGVVE